MNGIDNRPRLSTWWKTGMATGSMGLAVVAVMLVAVWAGLQHMQAAQAQGVGPSEAVGKGKAGKSGEAPPVAVHWVAARVEDVAIESRATATVVSLAALEVRPQLNAALKAVHIREGQFVRAGQLLFTLDDRNERASVDKAAAQVARDQAQLQDLQRQWQRSTQLVAQHYLAQGAADSLQAQVAQQQALLQADQAVWQAAQVALGFNRLVAAQSGRVGAINVFPGSLVSPATLLTSITQIDPVALSFTLPEAQLPALLAQQRLPSLATPIRVVTQLGGRELVGKLSFFDNSVESSTGTIRVKAEFANHEGALWPGQYVPAQLRLGTLKQAVVVPQAAIIAGNQGKFVYTVGENQSAKALPVTVVYAFGEQAVVRGLSGKERVIVEGKQNLRAGSRIKPLAKGAA